MRMTPHLMHDTGFYESVGGSPAYALDDRDPHCELQQADAGWVHGSQRTVAPAAVVAEREDAGVSVHEDIARCDKGLRTH